MHKLLKIDETTEKVGIILFNTCRQNIVDLFATLSDPRGGDDIDGIYTSVHACESVRCGIRRRPRAVSPFHFGTGVPWQRYRPSDATFSFWQTAIAAATPILGTKSTACTTAAVALQWVFLVFSFFPESPLLEWGFLKLKRNKLLHLRKRLRQLWLIRQSFDC